MSVHSKWQFPRCKQQSGSVGLISGLLGVVACSVLWLFAAFVHIAAVAFIHIAASEFHE